VTPGESLAGRHALVTGASGFVGANLVRGLAARGCRVTALLRPSSNPWRLAGAGGAVEVAHAGVDDEASLAGLPDEALGDIVIHAAAAGVRPGEAEAAVMRANVRGTVNLLERIAAAGTAPRFVFFSSCSVYGDRAHAAEDAPLEGRGAYAASKVAGEALCRAYAEAGVVRPVILRLYTPYGPWEAEYRFVAGTLLRAMAGQELPVTPGEQTRDLIHVDDVVRATAAALAVDGVEGETINVCTGVATTIRDAVAGIVEAAGTGAVPRFGALPYRAAEIWKMSGDPSKMRRLLGVDATVPLAEGLARTRRWLEENAGVYRPALSR